jgi:hypothetical protein
MWFLNVVIPVILGSFFVLNYKQPLACEVKEIKQIEI